MVPKWKAYSIIAALFVLGFTAVGAITQIDLTSQVRGILPAANGGTGQNSTAVFPSSGTVMVTTTAVSASQLPSPGASSLGGVQSKDCSGAGQLVQSINTDGTVTCASAGAAPNFAAAETPSGTINGSNATFTLANSPTGSSLELYKNGQLMIAGASADYTLSTSTITFNSGAIPKTGDALIAFYRY